MTSTDIFKLSDVYKYKENGDDPDIPQRVLNMFSNKKHAEKSWKNTLKWRLSYNIDEKYIENDIIKKRSKILSMPHVHFNKLKKYYPSFVLGKSKNNNPVFLERWDKINFKNLRKLKIKKKYIIWHYIYCYEWLWNHYFTDDNIQTINIIDVNNIKIFDHLKSDLFSIIKILNKIFGTYYLGRTYRIIVINFPPMGYKIFNMLLPLINKEYVERMTIHEQGDYSEIHKYIDINLIPEEYGGKNKENIAENYIEKRLSDFVNLQR